MEALNGQARQELSKYYHGGRTYPSMKEYLIKMGCIDKNTGHVTEYGHRIMALPLYP